MTKYAKAEWTPEYLVKCSESFGRDLTLEEAEKFLAVHGETIANYMLNYGWKKIRDLLPYKSSYLG